jgi:N-acetylmuramoyl-L-alanine amidase
MRPFRFSGPTVWTWSPPTFIALPNWPAFKKRWSSFERNAAKTVRLVSTRLRSLLAFGVVTFSPALNAQPNPELYVVIDPGHGGSDVGVQIGEQSEKAIVLEVAKRLEQLFAGKAYPKIILTRHDDYGLSMDERRRIANIHRSGLFVSLHMAAAPNASVHGPRIYALGSRSTAPDDLVLPIQVAHRPYAMESLRWASILTDQFLEKHPEATMQIAPLPLAPLLGVTLPAAMVELDHLSSLEAARWKEPPALHQAAAILASAIDRWFAPGNNPPL